MNISSIDTHFVLIANNFNLSIFRETWFVNEGILTQEEINPTTSLFTPNIIQIDNEEFYMTIELNKLQIYLKGKDNHKRFNLVNKIVHKLSHVPYLACGLNFNYLIDDFDNILGSTLFSRNEDKLFDEFKNPSDKSLFGVYLSKNYMDTRLKLSVLPSRVIPAGENVEKDFMYYQFNFHVDLKEKNFLEKIQALISNTMQFEEYTLKLIDKI